MRPRLVSYARRNELLLELGFLSYEEYLASDLWQKIRLETMTRANWHCDVCHLAKAVSVHHRDYNRRALTVGGEDLYAICLACHEDVEITPTGRKRSVREAGERLGELLGERPVAIEGLCPACGRNPAGRDEGPCWKCAKRDGRRERVQMKMKRNRFRETA